MRMRIHQSALLIITGCLLPLFGSGCSTGNQAIQATAVSGTARGSVRITIHWPAIPQGRLIPLAAQSIQVTLNDSKGVQQASAASQRPFTTAQSGITSTITLSDIAP